MNAEVVPGIARPPRKEDYFPIVKGLRPFIEEEELQLRSSLLLMRDRAMATKLRASEYAWRVLDVVERLASDHAMNHRVKLDDLREMRRNCLNLIAAASNLEVMFREPPKPPEAA